MKKLIGRLLIFISSSFGGKYAGKLLGLFDYCRSVICSNNKVYAGAIHERMSMRNIIPISESDKDIGIEPSCGRIKVRIVYPVGDSWNNIGSIYQAFSNDDRYQCFVIVANEPRFVAIMKKVGCKYTFLHNYDVKVDRPDILITAYYSSADSQISFEGCRKYIGKVFAVIPNAVMNEKNNDIHWNYIKNAHKYLNPDYYLVDRQVFSALSGYIDGARLVEMGNPQFDELFVRLSQPHTIPYGWDKLKNRTIILWATDHGINESYPTNGFTVDLYLADMLHYFSKHPEFGLIFRPHPQFIREMILGGHFWNDIDLRQLKEYIDNTENIVWDDTIDFCAAYKTCDAILVDLNCSISCSALTTGKPICRLKRYDMVEWEVSKDLSYCYYYASNINECIDFFIQVQSHKDPNKVARNECLKKAILNFDGKNGERIKEFIETKIMS